MAFILAFPGIRAAAADQTQTTTSAQGDAKDSKEKKYSNISVLTGEEIDPELAAQRPIAVMYPIDKAAQPQNEPVIADDGCKGYV